MTSSDAGLASPPWRAAGCAGAAARHDRRQSHGHRERRARRRPTRPTPTRRARVRMELASGYFGRGQSDTALDEVKQALAVKPDLRRGLQPARPDLRQPGRRRRWPRRTSAARCSSIRATPTRMHNYGWFLCQRRRYAEAEAQFQQAHRQPQYARRARSLLAQGVCQARAGRWPRPSAASLARLRARSGQSGHRGQPGRRAVPARRVRTRALLHRPRQHGAASIRTRRRCGWRRASNTSWATTRGCARLGRQLRNRFPQSPRSRWPSNRGASMTERRDAPRAEARSAGAMLRAARERQGLHIAALAAAIKVPQAQARGARSRPLRRAARRHLRARAGADRLPGAEDRCRAGAGPAAAGRRTAAARAGRAAA